MIDIKKYHRKLIRPYLFLCFFLVLALSLIGISYSYYSDVSNVVSNIKTGYLNLSVQTISPIKIKLINPITNTIHLEKNNNSNDSNQQNDLNLLEDTRIKFFYEIKNIGTIPVSLKNYKIYLNHVEITNLFNHNDMNNIIPNKIMSTQKKMGVFNLPLTEYIKSLIDYSETNKISIIANYNQLNTKNNGWHKALIIENNINIDLITIKSTPLTEPTNKNELPIIINNSIGNSSEKGEKINNED